MRYSDGTVLLHWPLNEHIITAGWTYSDGSAHNAIDLRASVGTPVFAAEPGTVNMVQYWDGKTTEGNQSYGNLIRIRHSDYKGRSQLETYYAHLSKILVSNGQTVSEGQLIGYSGNSGHSTGPHLHFEVRLNRDRYNPLNWLDNDFTCANTTVEAHLGDYTSVERVEDEEENQDGYLGVDVSKYQGDIDWQKVAKDGVKFAIIRAGSQDNNGPYVDPYFEKNYQGAKVVGLKVGAYIFTYGNTEEEQNDELATWLPALEGKTFEYPVFVDVEANQLAGLSNLTALTKRMMDILDQKGFIPGWYSYTNFINANLDAYALKDYPLWVADYRENLGYKGDYMMWQYTSSGRVNGIDGNVDLNIDYSGICDDSEVDEPTPTPPVELKKLCVVNATNDIIAKAKELGLGVETRTAYIIGPASNGDVATIKSMADDAGCPVLEEV